MQTPHSESTRISSVRSETLSDQPVTITRRIPTSSIRLLTSSGCGWPRTRSPRHRLRDAPGPSARTS